jgi:hypothetical protein
MTSTTSQEWLTVAETNPLLYTDEFKCRFCISFCFSCWSQVARRLLFSLVAIYRVCPVVGVAVAAVKRTERFLNTQVQRFQRFGCRIALK